jgi:uncharacterized protein YdaU (DUF1376 family)
MAAPAYMPIYWGDYLADTAHLSRDEHGAYLLLIAQYWQRQAPLPDDDRKLAKMARATPEEWSGHLRDTLEEFFTIENGVWRQKRLDAEIETFNDRYKRQSEAGKRGRAKQLSGEAQGTPGAPPDHPRANGSGTPGQPTPTPTPTTVSNETDTPPEFRSGGFPRSKNLPLADKKNRAYPEAFERFWRAWPQNPNDTKTAAYEAWRKAANRKDVEISDLQAGAEKHAAHVADWPKDKRAHVQTWVNREGWTAPYDDLGGSSDKPFAGYVPLGVGG